MDFSLITEHGPAIGAALVMLLGAAWAAFKALAPLTKTTSDDEFIADHGNTVEDVLEQLEEKK